MYLYRAKAVASSGSGLTRYIYLCLKKTDSRGRTVAKGQPRTAYGMRAHGAASAAGFEALRN